MTDSETSFSSFWQRSKDAVSNKVLKFVPAVPKTRNHEDHDAKITVSKEKADRRTQVRRAQMEHRARKKNYVKHLEEEIAQLRASISAAEHESVALEAENSSIKAMLVHTNLSLGSAIAADTSEPAVRVSTVTIDFDEIVQANRLYCNNTTLLPSNQTDVAIDFILALEHPCRDHIPFHYHPVDFSAPANNHALLASTYLFQSAPASLFTADGQLSKETQKLQWQAPSLELETLLGLSRSLDFDDLEITPVQAWFELVERFDAGQVMRSDVIESLKRELGAVVSCQQCGAVMLRYDFEDCVRRVLGSQGCIENDRQL